MAKISRTRVAADTSNMDMPHDVENEAYAPEDNEDEAPARSRHSAVSSGWGAKQEERQETVKSPVLKLKDNGTRVIKALNALPPVKYKRHYVKSKNRYYTCIKTADTQCPLCLAGVRASWTFMINVVDLADDPNEVKTWTFGTEVSSQLQDIAENKAALDAIGTYFEVRHVKVAGRSAPSTSVSFLRARDLTDDHSLEPLNEEEIAELNEGRFGAEVVYINTADYLEDVANDVVPGDLPQKRN
jgi:hypothetical protein